MKDQWIEWLQDNQRRFFYGVILVVAVFFAAFQILGKFHKSPRQKLQANTEIFQKWLVQGEAFDKLEKALEQNPELEVKFGASIADKFIAKNDGDRAEPFAQKVLDRILKKTPEHASFSQTSLLIAKGKLEEALAEALSLKEKLDKDTLLFGFNLVRIASLCRATETLNAEKETLEELETYIQTHDQAASVLTQCFQEGDLTLLDYIQQRKSQIK